MRSLLLLSALIATMVIPLLASRTKRAKRGMRWTVVGMSIFIIFWGYAIRTCYWKLE